LKCDVRVVPAGSSNSTRHEVRVSAATLWTVILPMYPPDHWASSMKVAVAACAGAGRTVITLDPRGPRRRGGRSGGGERWSVSLLHILETRISMPRAARKGSDKNLGRHAATARRRWARRADCHGVQAPTVLESGRGTVWLRGGGTRCRVHRSTASKAAWKQGSIGRTRAGWRATRPSAWVPPPTR
jgi:hypothetical protein